MSHIKNKYEGGNDLHCNFIITPLHSPIKGEFEDNAVVEELGTTHYTTQGRWLDRFLSYWQCNLYT